MGEGRGAGPLSGLRCRMNAPRSPPAELFGFPHLRKSEINAKMNQALVTLRVPLL